VSYLYYADRLSQLPLGVIGIAIGTALLPVMARQVATGAETAAGEALNRALEYALLLALPAAAALAVAARPIIAALFERGAFGTAETDATAAALAAYAAGLPAWVLVKVLSTAFFARADTVRPMQAAVAGTAANIALALLLAGPFAHVGIAAAGALAAWLNAALLALLLARAGLLEPDGRLARRLPRIAAATFGLALALHLGTRALAGPLAGGTAARSLALALLVGGGLAAFALLAHALRAASLSELRRALAKKPA
jgi:putative peptidoglycan lipid II flippase